MTNLDIGAAYIRVSTDEQTELSPDAQLRVILEQAKKDGVTIPPEFIFIEKKGISGRRAENRPEFQRMIAIAKNQNESPFKRLYLWKFSRFARNQEESTFYKGILRKKCHVEIISVSEPIMEGMFGRLIETIIEWFDEYYSINLSGEVLRGMKEKALRNGYQLRPCLGYAAVGDGKPYQINESEYAVVEQIFRFYHSGLDMTGTARKLNALGYRTKSGNLFDRRAVYRILTNRFYIGEVSWNGIAFQGEHPVRESVSSIFDSVQERLQAEYRPRGRRESSANAHWLSGLLRCHICKATLGFNRTNNSKRRPDFFQCWKYGKGIHPESCSIAARRAEAAVLESLKQVISSGQVDYEYIRPQEPAAKTEEALIQESLDRLRMKEQRVREAYESGIDTLEEYKSNKLRLQAERRELTESMERLKKQAESPQQRPDQKEVVNRIKNVYDLLIDENTDYATKGNALRSVVKYIEYDRKNDRMDVRYYIS